MSTSHVNDNVSSTTCSHALSRQTDTGALGRSSVDCIRYVHVKMYYSQDWKMTCKNVGFVFLKNLKTQKSKNSFIIFE